MSADLNNTFSALVATFEERMREIADDAVRQQSLPAPGAVVPEASELQAKLQRIRVKEFVSTAEAAVLLGCSDGHLRNLVRRAKKKETRSPIPFRDLDGVVVFKLDELLAWTESPKGKLHSVANTLSSSQGADKLPALLAGRDSRKGAVSGD